MNSGCQLHTLEQLTDAETRREDDPDAPEPRASDFELVLVPFYSRDP